MTKKIAITGANGYIGSYLAAVFERQGKEVYYLCRTRPTNIDSRYFISFELQSNVEKNLVGIDVLIHCAYDFTPMPFEKNKIVNVDGSLSLFEQARKAGVKKIIYLSSTSAFSTAISDYGKIKYLVETAALKQHITVVKPGLVFNKDARGIVGALFKLVRKFSFIPVIGRGNQQFYPCHLEDLSQMIAYLSETPVSPAAAIVAASDKAISFKEIIRTIAKKYHKKVLLIPIPYLIIFTLLKTVELLKINIGFRSDSLKYIKQQNNEISFEETKRIPIKFRGFTPATIDS